MSEARIRTDPSSMASEPVLHVDAGTSEAQLAQAGRALARCEASVMLDGLVCIRPEAARLVCEVRDPEATAHRCAMELDVLVENARRALASSRLSLHLPARRLEWVVQEGA